MRERTLVVSIVGGLLGGLVGAAAMSAVHTGLSRIRPPDPPPSQAREDDSTVKVADALSRTFRDAPLPESAKPIAGSVVRAGERLSVPCPVLTELYDRAAAQLA